LNDIFNRFFNDQFFRFLIIGGINTLFGFLIYSFCIARGVEVESAIIIGTILGVVFNFITTGGGVFRQLSLKNLPRFLLTYILIYVVNIYLYKLISKNIASPILIQGILAIPLSLLSYFIMSRYVFKEKNIK
jgi:putative flippase GtrA